MVEENTNSAETRRGSVTFEKYVHSNKMQPQSSGSLRSNAGAEKGKEIAAKLNIHRIHGQLRGLDTSGKPFCNANLAVLCYENLIKTRIYLIKTCIYVYICKNFFSPLFLF